MGGKITGRISVLPEVFATDESDFGEAKLFYSIFSEPETELTLCNNVDQLVRFGGVQ